MSPVIRKTSIIICTFNRASLLPKVINNLRAQTYPAEAFEIIVVDNASTDNTRQVIERSNTETGKSVKYVIESRTGITFARNKGAEAARHPYLAYLDDDCSVGTDWLSQLMSGFDLDEQVEITAGQIIVDFKEQKKPVWLGAKSERWLGAYNHPGSQPRLLDNPVYICEGNMAITRQAWEAVGGFLGMDLFSSPHMASQEILYLLEQIKRKGGKIAFVPGAIANHHTDIPTKQWLIKRAFWNGVSSGILEYILYRHSGPSILLNFVLNTGAIFIFFAFSLFSLFRFDQASVMYHLLRAFRRIGLILSEFRLVGDWQRVRSWMPLKK
jgi:glucosyl-dolichyl phosphate glucuronosyltransferase